MKAFIAALGISAVVGLVVFVFSEKTESFRSVAAVAFEDAIPNEELDAAREPLVAALPAVLDAIEAQGPPGVLGDGVSVSLGVTDSVSRVDVAATTADVASARALADRVASGLQDRFLATRRSSAQADVDAVAAKLDGLEASRLTQQVGVDLAIAAEAMATADVQRIVLAGGDEVDARAEMAETIELVRSAAAARDEVADEQNRVRAELLALEVDVALAGDSVFLVPGSSAESMTGSPVRNGIQAALIALVTLLTSLSILRLAKSES